MVWNEKVGSNPPPSVPWAVHAGAGEAYTALNVPSVVHRPFRREQEPASCEPVPQASPFVLDLKTATTPQVPLNSTPGLQPPCQPQSPILTTRTGRSFDTCRPINHSHVGHVCPTTRVGVFPRRTAGVIVSLSW
jgi:hypothetical protein